MKERELWCITIEALEAFHATPPHERTISPEETAEELLKGCVAVAPQERVFARECAAGLVRFEKLCEGALKGYCRYCHRHKKTDRFSMLLMAYILIFRYTELGGHKVRDLFNNCTDINCIAEYMEYLLNIDALIATAMPLWLQSYDKGFLDTVVLKNLRDILTDARREVVDWYRARSEISVVPQHSTSNQESQSFTGGPNRSLSGTQVSQNPLPRLEPSVVPHGLSPTRLPQMMEGEEAQELRQLVFADNHRLRLPPKEVRDMIHTVPEPRKEPIPVMEPPLPPPPKPLTQPIGFAFHREPPRESKYHPRSPVDDCESARNTDRSPEVHPYIPLKGPAEPIRQTNAALLREVTTHLSRKATRMQELKAKEACPHDSAGYERWKEQEACKEEQKREMDIIQRHLDAVRTEEKVRQQKEAAKERRTQEIKENRAKQKQDSERRARVLQRQQEAQKGYVQFTREQLAGARQAAMERNLFKKSEAMSEVRNELARRKLDAKADEEALQLERAGVIKDIKQLRERIKRHQVEFVETNRNVAYAPPSTHEAFLDSMSIVELRGELAQMKERFRIEEEERRKLIVQNREKNKTNRSRLIALCEAEREKIRRVRVASRADVRNTREEVKAAKQAIEADHMLALHEKLETKREIQREELGRLREMERQHLNEVLLRAEDFHGKEQRRWEQEERSHIKRVMLSQSELSESSKLRVLH